MKFISSTERDIEQLSGWIQNDPYHKDCLNPLWWLTGQGFLAYCVWDDRGPTMYVRIDKEGDLMRLHCQFSPELEVSKRRVIRSLTWALPKMQILGEQHQMKGFVFRSVSPTLIAFMQKKFGFVFVGRDDYKMLFEEQ
jgi:hypothetical protein